MQLAGLASDGGENLLTIADRAPGGATLAVVVADDPDAPVLDAAERRGIETYVPGGDPADREARIIDHLDERAVGLVCLDGWHPDPSEEFLGDGPPTLAVTRSLSPDHPGGWNGDGDDPVAAALSAGVQITGCTVRLLGENGGVVTQEPVPAYADDDRSDLRARIDEAITTAYPRAVRWFAAGDVTVEDGIRVEADHGGRFPSRWLGTADRERELRYGENPHQDAAVYGRATDDASVVGPHRLNEGAKSLSYNNYNDADGALGLIAEFDRPAAAVIKHTNPAGCATADSLATAYDRALATDPESAFGGVVALDRECDRATAESITDSYKEVVVAPGYTDEATTVLCDSGDLRVLDVGALPDERPRATVEKQIAGGRLIQDRDDQRLSAGDLEVVTEREPTDEQVETMLFAWPTVKHVASNAIVLAAGTETVGVGAGQMSRVDAVRLATTKAREDARGKSPEGSVMASDAFFPFPDGIEAAADAGVEAVVQPGGSVKDDEVIRAADDLGLAMAFTGQRAFRHD